MNRSQKLLEIIGMIPGMMAGSRKKKCPKCDTLMVHHASKNYASDKCPNCGKEINT